MNPDPDAATKPARRRGLEVFFFAAGGLLLAFSGGATLLGRFQKGRDLLRFQEALAAPAPRAGAPAGAAAASPDTKLWSPERIKAYEESRRAATGAPLAVLRIPKIGLEVPVLEGTDELTLNRAVGLIEDTARPGESGNVGIAGHRDGFFRGLMDVKAGDRLELETLTGKTTYTVEFIRIVQPEDASVLDPTPRPALTLVTCYPFYFVGSAPQRYIVRAAATPTQTTSLPGPRRETAPVRSP
jgi:sortase A